MGPPCIGELGRSEFPHLALYLYVLLRGGRAGGPAPNRPLALYPYVLLRGGRAGGPAPNRPLALYPYVLLPGGGPEVPPPTAPSRPLPLVLLKPRPIDRAPPRAPQPKWRYNNSPHSRPLPFSSAYPHQVVSPHHPQQCVTTISASTKPSRRFSCTPKTQVATTFKFTTYTLPGKK